MTFSELSVWSTFSLLTQTFDPAYIPSNTSEYPPKANGLAPTTSRGSDKMCDGGRRIWDMHISCSSLKATLKASPAGSRSPRAYSRFSERKLDLKEKEGGTLSRRSIFSTRSTLRESWRCSSDSVIQENRLEASKLE